MNKPLAIVTGASRGIGKAIAVRLITKGYDVVGFYKSNDAAAQVLTGQGIDMQKVDVGSDTEVAQAIERVVKRYQRIDLLVNNAGIDIPGKVESYPLEAWERMVATDITSVYLLSKYAIPHLKGVENACIINISSRIGIGEYTEPEFVIYGAVKAAVNNLTVGLSKELDPYKIRVNAVIPAPTKTDLFDEVFTAEDEAGFKARGKLGTPEDVTTLVLQIIDDKSLNGQLVFDHRVRL
jgi:3-oxoacyl-[acyl-carrier protein] reductase